MVEINNLLNETEKLSLLPDRYYLILKPRGDGSFDVVAYDTTDPSKPVDSTFYVLKGIMETLEIDLDRLVQLGQMAVIDKVVELQGDGKSPTTELLDTDVEQIDMGKKH
tara:strand:+ start:255 stop:581 length:327 start_codon:yes stop_codon:yes gene_type:complete